MSEQLENAAETTEDEVTTELEGVVEDNADNDNDAEFLDTTADELESETGGKPPQKTDEDSNDKPWKNEKNAQEAAKRREATRQAEIKKARSEAIIEALSGMNPYTNEKIEDDADVEEYLTMKEIDKSGKDPITDYSRFLKSKSKQKEIATQAQLSQADWIQKDREDFQAKNPGAKFDELASDELFKAFAAGKVGTTPMTKIYADYKAFEKQSEQRANKKVAQILANNAATPGKLSHKSQPMEKSVKDLSKAEFEAMVERVKRGEQK